MIPFDKRDGKIWYNNELIDWQNVKLHVLSHGLHYASCIFEGLRVYDGEIFKLEEHTERFFYSAKRMGMELPYTQEELNNATKETVAAQNVQNGYIRPFAWRGSEMMAISAQKTKIHVAIASWEWGTYFDPKLKTEGIKLNISKWKRPAPDSVPWDTKASGLYMICTLSKHEAERKGLNHVRRQKRGSAAWRKLKSCSPGESSVAAFPRTLLSFVRTLDWQSKLFLGVRYSTSG